MAGPLMDDPPGSRSRYRDLLCVGRRFTCRPDMQCMDVTFRRHSAGNARACGTRPTVRPERFGADKSAVPGSRSRLKSSGSSRWSCCALSLIRWPHELGWPQRSMAASKVLGRPQPVRLGGAGIMAARVRVCTRRGRQCRPLRRPKRSAGCSLRQDVEVKACGSAVLPPR